MCVCVWGGGGSWRPAREPQRNQFNLVKFFACVVVFVRLGGGGKLLI